jgi:hypothetical protein
LVTDPKGNTELLGGSENRMFNRKVGPKREQALGNSRLIMRKLITPHEALTSYCKRDETKNNSLDKGRSIHGEITACIN